MARTARRVALVTGAANGIGRAIARQLLNSGWRVGALDLPQTGLQRAFARSGGNAVAIEGDVADENAVENAVAAVHDNFGRLDGIVSNAGIMIRKPLCELTVAEWHRVIDVNLTGTFLLARTTEKFLRQAKGGLLPSPMPWPLV
jgi:NAD(P)-dependent dehydrogenase (short-subunit alcohol dehydrogenase family)